MKAYIKYVIAAGLILVAGVTDYTLFHRKNDQAKPKADDDHAEQVAIMNDAKMTAAGIELAQVGPQTLRETLRANGILQANQEALVQVTPRFPGIVREVYKRVGDSVAKGDLLAKIESNQSLTTYELRSPIDGTVIDRQVTLGEYVSEQKPALIVANLSTVWADFAVQRRDLSRVKVGDTVLIDPADGGEKITATLSYLSPLGTIDTQTGLARAIIKNPDDRLRPGLFVTGRIVMAERRVPAAVAVTALQTIDNRTIVFVRHNDKFEPRAVEIGQRDSEFAEVKDGLHAGTTYASKNSFVVKAELGKAAAAHED
jgi:cobalt-zinc-cadmium efflux system membrane fusion protein